MIVEILIYLVSAISALFITGFAVHMFVGGLVSPETEYQLITIACLIVVCVTAYMTWDVIQRRAGKK
jgi:hypothetical protein